MLMHGKLVNVVSIEDVRSAERKWGGKHLDVNEAFQPQSTSFARW